MRSVALSLTCLAVAVEANNCRDVGNDCCANFVTLEPATCATGSRPDRQPMDYNGGASGQGGRYSAGSNYKCDTYSSLEAEQVSGACMDTGIDGMTIYLPANGHKLDRIGLLGEIASAATGV